jgi:putative ABC transport system substrate-binding protein
LAAWPLAARAQQSAMPVVGLLSSRSPADTTAVVNAFRNGLGEGGYFEGKNVTIEYRWAEGRYDRLPALASELVSRQVPVIATGGDVATLAAKTATTTIPVVFDFGGDPVKFGLISSLNRPGGNVTGVSLFAYLLDAKRVEIMRELIPGATTIALLANPDNPQADAQFADVEAASRTLGNK